MNLLESNIFGKILVIGRFKSSVLVFFFARAFKKCSKKDISFNILTIFRVTI